MGPPCFIQKLYPSNNAKLIPWINATQTHSINNYQSICKSLGVIRWEIDISDDKSTFNELASHHTHSKYNGKWRGGERWNFMLSQKRKYKKWLLYYFDNSFMSNDRTPMDKKMYIIGINKKQFKTLFYQ